MLLLFGRVRRVLLCCAFLVWVRLWDVAAVAVAVVGVVVVVC